MTIGGTPPSSGARTIGLLLACALIAFLAGCATSGDSSTADSYRPPENGSATAFLKGSRLTEGGLFGSEHRGFATMIDLKPLPNAANRWNESIPLTAGKHTIAAEYRYSNFVARAYLTLEAKAGVSYQLMIKHSNVEGRLYNDFWIVDLATGQPVTKIHHQQVNGGKKGTIFNIPS